VDQGTRSYRLSANYPLRSHEGDVVAAKFSPNLDLLATGSSDKQCVYGRFIVLAGFPIDLRGHTSAVRDLATTSDGSWLASGSGDGIVRLWNEGDSKVGLHPIEAGKHAGAIYRVAISPDNRWLASGGQDASILL
jgi:WD40 repeat protein